MQRMLGKNSILMRVASANEVRNGRSPDRKFGPSPSKVVSDKSNTFFRIVVATAPASYIGSV